MVIHSPRQKHWVVLNAFCFCFSHKSESEQLEQLEEEQEQLNSSLLALTTHFAQVQFRLKQIVNADPTDREVSIWERVMGEGQGLN